MLLVLGIILGLALIILALVGGIVLFFNRNSADKIITKHQGENDMFTKKYPEADVHRYSSTFFRVGLIFALGLVIFAFTYSEGGNEDEVTVNIEGFEEIEVEPPQTIREPPPPPPPPPPEIVVVEDEEIVEEEPDFEIPEIEEETVIDIPEPEPEEEIVEEEIFRVVEDMPVFPGGDAGLMKYLASIPYPPIARENDIEGTVYINFVVGKDGKVSDVGIARSSGDKLLDEAAVNHIKKMPAWSPGKQRGKPVKVQYTVPIKFKLS